MRYLLPFYSCRPLPELRCERQLRKTPIGLFRIPAGNHLVIRVPLARVGALVVPKWRLTQTFDTLHARPSTWYGAEPSWRS